ncbi:MAG: DNA polymerase III subunit gamma/tau, partial [Candidatus Faecousia sp.]|nr:DNA polymerase III subunit gamma/tau [Candidatus Faecousia sp.]
MYQALYRKYRPQTFDDVVGQQAVTQTLKTQLVTGKMSHAYLFTGSRGTGKTSCAKILAKAVNCLQPENGNPCNRCAACRAIDDGSCLDVLEIDAASNNGVDNVRDLRDDAIYTPSQVKKRVYIIDEVHMLSISAFNALLKIIEEPPEHLLFILATTELNKVPATILSRCQRFAFRRISQEDIASRLQYVAYQENIDLDASAARVLARLADGGMRDGLSLLDQVASATTGELNAETVYRCLGIAGERSCGELMGCIADHHTKKALDLFNRLYTEGKDLAAMLDELCTVARDLLILRTASKGVSLISGVCTEKELQTLLPLFSPGELLRMIRLLRDAAAGFNTSANRRIDAELCLIRLCEPEAVMDAESLNARLSRLETKIAAGSFVAPQTA